MDEAFYAFFYCFFSKDSDTWTNDSDLKARVTFSVLKSIEFKEKIDCALPFVFPQVNLNKNCIQILTNT